MKTMPRMDGLGLDVVEVRVEFGQRLGIEKVGRTVRLVESADAELVRG